MTDNGLGLPSGFLESLWLVGVILCLLFNYVCDYPRQVDNTISLLTSVVTKNPNTMRQQSQPNTVELKLANTTN